MANVRHTQKDRLVIFVVMYLIFIAYLASEFHLDTDKTTRMISLPVVIQVTFVHQSVNDPIHAGCLCVYRTPSEEFI